MVTESERGNMKIKWYIYRTKGMMQGEPKWEISGNIENENPEISSSRSVSLYGLPHAMKQIREDIAKVIKLTKEEL
jgi:hypothetical protein